MAEKGDGVLQTIINASKGNVDFLAFALIAVLSVGSLTRDVDFWSAAGIAVVLAVAWVLSRYALLALQSRERLRAVRETAMIEAQKKIAEHATQAEMDDLFEQLGRTGGDDEH